MIKTTNKIMFTEILKFCKLRNSIRKFKEDQKDQEEDALNQASSLA